MSQPVSATAKRKLAELEALHAAMKDEPDPRVRDAAYADFGRDLFKHYGRKGRDEREGA